MVDRDATCSSDNNIELTVSGMRLEVTAATVLLYTPTHAEEAHEAVVSLDPETCMQKSGQTACQRCVTLIS